ncbi:transcription-repair coupling factor [Quisquiliibacterium transsilvanicum]|uniref:transcription-repair coupling factor n=1 Tax=Quisquiliibacterium transsilvanicum TaxID=1549638 RepID=UPI00160FA3D2
MAEVLARNIKTPKPGAVHTLPRATGSSDALLIAHLARAGLPAPTAPAGAPPDPAQQPARALAVIAASAPDAQRLADEIAFFAPGLTARLLPDWETLPYDNFSPHQDLISERLDTLFLLQQGRCDVVVATATTALHRLAPPSFLASHTFFFDKGQRLDEAALRTQLAVAGYDHVTQVVRPGEYSVRGGLIDLYPMGATLPYRLDMFGDEIDSIRTFDPDSQRSLFPIDRVRLLPGREFPLDEQARAAFRGRWRERFEGDPSKAGVYRDVGNGIASAGIEYWLPLFFEATATVFDYLPAGSLVLTHGDVDGAARRFGEEAVQRHRFLAHDRERPLLRPDELFLDSERFFVEAARFGRWSMASPLAAEALAADTLAVETRVAEAQAATPAPAASEPAAGRTRLGQFLPSLAVNRRAEQPLALLEQWLAQPPLRKLILAESAGRRETLVQLFEEHRLLDGGAGQLPQVDDWAGFVDGGHEIAIGIGPLHEGFALPEAGIAVATEAELFAGVARRGARGRREAQTNVDAIIRDLSELKVGDPVVHAQHGIGRYEGLVTMDLGDGPTEFLHLIYANKATLYVPVSQLHVIGRYSGASPDEAPLHTLGSGQWEKARRRAAQQARDTAAELLNIYARRAARQGHGFQFKTHDYEAFAEGFGFEETPDQLAAIHAVVQDMVSGRPMDRLVCGDVGFGKTEVALRAAFVAIADGQQVAVLAPTTLLAEQHFQTFSDRFGGWPVRLAELSRFRSGKEVKAAIEGINAGQIDIVIGTHKLLSGDVKFPRLGLVIIDEEHRFGVRQKEALKSLRAEVDVLTLTATPIPRTLAMSLESIRDFSVIATAPQRRLAIKTFVRKESDGTIREALLRELKRGGQCYFLHNEVDTIGNRRQMLEKLVPEARIGVAHGQMPERELERVMRDFHQQRYNVLLCTTIIETGIDVPSANTIVMHRADRFGLAQLHQLRGRVGRSHHQAYAYLLIPDEGAITKDATKRLEAIQSMEELGSGFYLAMHDLEIRGAGEVLGDSQSGDMQEVGFALYNEMLNEAVRALKAGHEPDLSAPLAATTEINLHMPALLPTDYCADVHERLTLYKRLANCDTVDALDTMQEELVDRFGKLPEAARALVDTHRLRILSKPLGISRIDASGEAIAIQFVPKPPIEPEKIIRFIQSRRDARLAGPDRLRLTVNSTDLASRMQRIREVFKALS